MIVGDIENIIDDLKRFSNIDFVFGGPSYQDFSIAGKMNSHDERSKLVFTFLRAVDKIKPRTFIMENVKALGSLKKWEDVRTEIFLQAEQMGYNCSKFILNATEYGYFRKEKEYFLLELKEIRIRFLLIIWCS